MEKLKQPVPMLLMLFPEVFLECLSSEQIGTGELRRPPPTGKMPENLNDLFMELFDKEYLESRPSEEIEAVIDNLKQAELSGSGDIPPVWSAWRNVLQKRGFLG